MTLRQCSLCGLSGQPALCQTSSKSSLVAVERSLKAASIRTAGMTMLSRSNLPTKPVSIMDGSLALTKWTSRTPRALAMSTNGGSTPRMSSHVNAWDKAVFN